jgi:AMP deaminase
LSSANQYARYVSPEKPVHTAFSNNSKPVQKKEKEKHHNPTMFHIDTDTQQVGLSDALESGSNSPTLGASHHSHFDGSSDDGAVGSEPGNGRDGFNGEGEFDDSMLPEAHLSPDQHASDAFSPTEEFEGMLDRDRQRRTAYYDYVAEKSMSQADAKLFYQRSKLEAQKSGGSNWATPQHSELNSPVVKPKSYPNLLHVDQLDSTRPGSMQSAQSGQAVQQELV